MAQVKPAILGKTIGNRLATGSPMALDSFRYFGVCLGMTLKAKYRCSQKWKCREIDFQYLTDISVRRTKWVRLLLCENDGYSNAEIRVYDSAFPNLRVLRCLFF